MPDSPSRFQLQAMRRPPQCAYISGCKKVGFCNHPTDEVLFQQQFTADLYTDTNGMNSTPNFYSFLIDVIKQNLAIFNR